MNSKVADALAALAAPRRDENGGIRPGLRSRGKRLLTTAASCAALAP
jgi:hypothetical protein